MLLNPEQSVQYRERIARIEALQEMARRAADQSNALAAQAREHRRNAELLERELYECFLPSIERDLGLSPADRHYVAQAWQIVTTRTEEATVGEVSAEAKQDVASGTP